MAKEEIKRFNEDVLKYQKLIADIKDAGSDLNKIVAVANDYGFNFTVEDLNELKLQSQERKDSQKNDSVVVLTDVVVVQLAIVI